MDGNPAWAVTSIASMLTVMIYALGGVSGGHFNPAVTFAIALSNEMTSWATVGLYIVVQIVAAVLAGFTYLGVYSHLPPINLEPAPGFSWIAAGMVEVLYTLMLCIVVLNAAYSKKNAPNQYAPLAIGFVVVAGGYGAGRISMGCFNPAVAIGVDFGSISVGLGWCAAYASFELLGATLAALLYRLLRPKEFQMSLPDLMPKLLAEFLGTFYLALSVGFNMLPTPSHAGAWSIAASLMSMIYALGSCSGAHLNPAVTLAVLCAGRQKITPVEAAAYMSVQIVGGLCGACTASMTIGQQLHLPNPHSNSMGWPAVGVAEFLFTFLLCLVVLSVATIQTPLKDMFGFAIGMCVTVGGVAIGSLSGGCLNPAVALGVGVTSEWLTLSFFYWGGFLFYWIVMELLAGAAAAGVFRYFRPEEFSKELEIPLLIARPSSSTRYT